jgi:hypothetical protein
MLTPEEEKFISGRAYIPEHILNLMVPISKGEPYLSSGYLYFLKKNWIIFVGYPLGYAFRTEDLERVLEAAIKEHKPEYLWLIAPEIPRLLIQSCRERESDHYYKLELGGFDVKKDKLRAIRKASKDLKVERGRSISKEHAELISEFLEKERPRALIRELFLSMQKYVNISKDAIVLSAFDKKGGLTAFYVVEMGAFNFATYVVGCYSRENYVPHASDLLFFEMINLAKENGKGYIHLGLGVNEGIRRFKEKWGGIPFLKYEFCEYRPPKGITGIFDMMRMLSEGSFREEKL